MTTKRNFILITIFLLSLIHMGNVYANPVDESAKKQTKKNSAPKVKANKNTKYAYVGNTFSKKYHLPGCEFAQKINIYHVKLLKTKEQAEKINYKACNWCMPRWTKSVRSKIIK